MLKVRMKCPYITGLEKAHTLLTPEELLHYFGVTDPAKVDHDR